MPKFSIGISQNLMMNKLISIIRVRRKRSGYATYTDKQQHRISADILARKWIIGIDKQELMGKGNIIAVGTVAKEI